MVIPLDRSKAAEQVLPYARFLAKGLKISVDLLGVVDHEALKALANPKQGRFFETLVAEHTRRTTTYLDTIKRSFPGGAVNCFVENGKPEEVVIAKAAADKGTLIAMSTHGRSGIQRWVFGSVADKVLHGATNHVLLVRAREQGKTDGEAALKTVVVPLDGSALAEQVLPYVEDLAKKMKLEIMLMRTYALPPTVTAETYGPNLGDLVDQLEAEAREYLDKKVKEIKWKGIENVSLAVDLGYGAEEIIGFARKTPDSFIAMCTHGRSGIKRWVLGSVTERVMRHSGDPVLIVRAA
jgi:nucleotide-binding universal stress UspA family protein